MALTLCEKVVISVTWNYIVVLKKHEILVKEYYILKPKSFIKGFASDNVVLDLSGILIGWKFL